MPDNKSHQINYYYAYSDFMKILNGYGKTTIINNQDIENNTKLDYDVIILITPTEPISKVQVKKLDNFVKNGGRLVLITDHTNLYGHIDSVHGLLQNFGTRMNDDAVFNANNYYEKALLKFNDGTQEYWNNICLSKTLKLGKNTIVYLGNRRWAFVVPNGTFLGTPELSDNYTNSLNLKWVAKRTNNYVNNKEKTRNGCIINRFSIGTKYPAP